MPDVLALAKGLTGGYLPLAATLTTEEIFQSFSGDTNRTFSMVTATLQTRWVALPLLPV